MIKRKTQNIKVYKKEETPAGDMEEIPIQEIQTPDDLKVQLMMQEVVEEPPNLESCPHCSRTFLPERLKIHLKSCKAERPLKMRV
jgi:hypothetical protein